MTDSIAYIGSGGPRFFLSLAPIDPNPHLAFVVVNTETAAQVPGAVARSRARLLAAFPEVRGRVKPMWLGGTETGLLEVRLIGPGADELYAKAIALIEALAAIPGTLDVKHRLGRSGHQDQGARRPAAGAPGRPHVPGGRAVGLELHRRHRDHRLSRRRRIDPGDRPGGQERAGRRSARSATSRSIRRPVASTCRCPRSPISRRSGSSAASSGAIRSVRLRFRPSTNFSRPDSCWRRSSRPSASWRWRPATGRRSAARSRRRPRRRASCSARCRSRSPP